MIQPKTLVAAFAFVGLIATGSIANAESRFYVEAGGSWSNDLGNVSAKFTTENVGAVWDLDDMKGAKVQIGGDFGMFRTDLKLRAMYGDVNAITGVTDVNGQAVRHAEPAQFATATINGYIDIAEIEMGETATITPYVGLGGGYAIGFMEANGTLAGVFREEHNSDSSNVWSGTIGALFSLNEHFGLSVDYERIHTDLGGIDADTWNAGLRVTF